MHTYDVHGVCHSLLSKAPTCLPACVLSGTFSPLPCTIRLLAAAAAALGSELLSLQVQSASLHVSTIYAEGTCDECRWHAYGGKQIRGCKHPRKYSRCVVEGCEAKRRIQLCDDKHTTRVAYLGRHRHAPGCEVSSRRATKRPRASAPRARRPAPHAGVDTAPPAVLPAADHAAPVPAAAATAENDEVAPRKQRRVATPRFAGAAVGGVAGLREPAGSSPAVGSADTPFHQPGPPVASAAAANAHPASPDATTMDASPLYILACVAEAEAAREFP